MMPEWIKELLISPCFAIGNAIWKLSMAMITGVITATPQEFSGATWVLVTQTLYPWALGMGVVLLNLFFIIGFYRSAANLKENMTWEILINYLIKAIVANALMKSGLAIMREFFVVASKLAGQVLTFTEPSLAPDDIDAGTALFFIIFGIIYVLVALVCSVLMFLTVYGRYLKLYVMVVFAPVALSTWAGGRGIENSAYAWIRSFLANVFEIVAIALVISIGGRMIQSIDFGTLVSKLGQFIDGFGAVIQSMLTMILMTAAVKATDSYMKRAFAL